MVKKLQKMAEKQAASAGGLFDSQITSTVKDSAQQIWLAGLGAFAKAQEEGSKVFEALVKEGVSLQKKTRGAAEEKLGEMTGKMTSMAGEVTSKAGQQWDKLEAIFEERTAKAMGKLGVPTKADVEALKKRIDELNAKIAKMSKAPVRARTAASTKRAAGKTT